MPFCSELILAIPEALIKDSNTKMALLAAAQMMHISKETHNSEEHLSFLNFLNASFPRKLVITHSKGSDMSLLPVKNLVELRYTRSDKNFTWTAEKKSNGFYSFRDHNGEYLSCPPYPKNGQPLLIKHPADIINQHFIVQYAPNTKEQGYTIRCRESPNPYVGAVLEDGAEVTLSTTFNSSRDVWYFKVD